MKRCVILATLDDPAPYLVQPTGRMEFCATGQAPERQWQIEVMDTRDGRLKMIAQADITKWALPLGSGYAPVVGVKIANGGA